MMREGRDITIERAAAVCVDFTRQVHFHRAINEQVTDNPSNFWILASNNFVDMAILDWCHLFNSHSDDLHFRNVLLEPDAFHTEMLRELRWDAEQYGRYREALKTYRDTEIAHNGYNPALRQVVPDLSYALKMVGWYYDTMLPDLRKIWRGYPSFEPFLNNIRLQMEDLNENLLPDVIQQSVRRIQI